MRVISFYTTGGDSSYEADAELLRESLDAIGVDYIVEAVPDMGGWCPNTAHKAAFIHEKREWLRGPLLWIDADAYVHADFRPYFDGLARDNYDFGAHFFQGPAKGHRTHQIRETGWRLLSGTTWWNDTPRAHKLARVWLALNQTLKAHGVPEGGGQKNLWYAVMCLQKQDLSVARLPGRYCYVFDKPHSYPHKFRLAPGSNRCDLCDQPLAHAIHTDEDEPRIIEHTIASRDHRATRQHTKERARRIEDFREGGHHER